MHGRNLEVSLGGALRRRCFGYGQFALGVLCLTACGDRVLELSGSDATAVRDTQGVDSAVAMSSAVPTDSDSESILQDTGVVPPSIASGGGTATTSEVSRAPDTRPPTLADQAPPPIMGGTLLVTRDGSTAVAGDPARDQISFVDLAQQSLKRTLVLEAGSEPGRITEDAAGRIYVALRAKGQVLLTSQQGDELETVNVCSEPRGLTYDEAGQRVLTACTDGQLMSIDTNTLEPTLLAQLPPDLRDVLTMSVNSDVAAENADSSSAQPTTHIFVTRFRAAELLELDSEGNVLSTTSPPQVTTSRTLVQEPIAEPNVTPTAGPDVTAPQSVVQVDSPMLPTVAWRTVAQQDALHAGQVVMLHQRAVADELQATTTSTGYGGNPCEAVVQSAITVVEGGSGVESGNVVTSAPIAGSQLPVDVAVSPDGTQIAVAAAGIADPDTPRELLFPDTEEGPSIAPTTAVGETPGLGPTDVPLVHIFSANMDGNLRPYGEDSPCPSSADSAVAGMPGEQATAVAFNPVVATQLLTLVRQPPQLIIKDTALSDSEIRISLEGQDITDTGHDLFHRVDTSIACAHCHPEGGDDGHVWRFEDLGQRRTQSLNTGVHAPFHWDGALGDLDQLMTEVFVGRMSAAPQSPERVQALARWLDALRPPIPAQPEESQELIQQGQALFTSSKLACNTCHSGSRFTDNSLHDVGTSDKPMKTPSLLGVAERLPLMHDGCADTLRARFAQSCGGGDAHGVTSDLTSDELDALVAYLETL